MGPSMYGVEVPSPSSSLRCRIEEVLAFGRDKTEGRRRAGTAGPSSSGLGGSDVTGQKREVDDDCAEARLSESFFMLRGWGLVEGGKMKESVSEVPEERVEAEAKFAAGTRELSAWRAGVSMDSGATGGFLRCENEVNADWGRGVAASML